MRCREARGLIPLHAGGDIPEKASELDAHLGECPGCAAEFKAFELALRSLRRAGDSSPRLPASEFLEGVRRRIEHPAPAAKPPALSWIRLAGATAAAAALAAVAALVLSALTGPAEDDSIAPVFRPRPAGKAPPASGIVETAPAKAVQAVSFELTASTLSLDSGLDLFPSAGVVPDPSAKQHDGPEEFMLRELTPVSDGEVCADF